MFARRKVDWDKWADDLALLIVARLQVMGILAKTREGPLARVAVVDMVRRHLKAVAAEFHEGGA